MKKRNTTAYAIYKSRDDKDVHAVYVFTQEEHNHRAKAAAKEKIEEMWRYTIQHPDRFRRIEQDLSNSPFCGVDGFSYDYRTSANTTERVHFYIAKHKVSKSV